MNLDFITLRKNAAEKLKGCCRVCTYCNGYACAGEVPGMGGIGTGSAFKANIEALAKYRFNMRTIHEVKSPNTSIEIWGERLSMPVLAAPMTGTTYNMGGKITEEDFTKEILAGCLMSETIGMTGDGADPTMFESGLKAIRLNQGKGIAIIKPREVDEVIRRIIIAEATGVLAVGMDIDGAGLVTMAMKNQPVSPKTLKELKEIVSSTKLPFVLKGIMTPEEAEIAIEAGVSAIVVSNHGGRVLDHTPGAADVLPEISKRVKKRVLVFADGGVRSGADVLKLLALGADAVLIGRPLIIGVFGGNRDGVSFLLNKIKGELIQAMLLTGTSDVKNVSSNILWKDSKNY